MCERRVTLFASLGNVAITDNAAMAKGISIALNTTLMGLIVAIPALIAGCTEIPLGLPADAVDVPLIDPALVLAQALVRRAMADGGAVQEAAQGAVQDALRRETVRGE